MNIDNIITPKLIIKLASEKKENAILELLKLIESNCNIPNPKLLTKKIFHREELMSTGIGLNLGIPHTRIKGVLSPIIAIGVQPKGIADYESLDNLPVKILIMIICGDGQHRVHVKLLSQILSRFKKDKMIGNILKAETNADIYNIINNK